MNPDYFNSITVIDEGKQLNEIIQKINKAILTELYYYYFSPLMK